MPGLRDIFLVLYLHFEKRLSSFLASLEVGTNYVSCALLEAESCENTINRKPKSRTEYMYEGRSISNAPDPLPIVISLSLHMNQPELCISPIV